MIENISERLRRQAFDLRRKPIPLTDMIPLMQEAALHIENLEMYIKNWKVLMNPIQALIEQLSNPKPSYIPGSTQPVIKPPSPLELRAAKALFEAYKDRLPSVEVVVPPPAQEPTLNYIL